MTTVILSPENRRTYILDNPDINTNLLFQHDNRSILTYEYYIVEIFKNTIIYQENVNDCRNDLDLKKKLKDAYNYIISFLKVIDILDFTNIDNYFSTNFNDLNEHEKKYEYVYYILEKFLKDTSYNIANIDSSYSSIVSNSKLDIIIDFNTRHNTSNICNKYLTNIINNFNISYILFYKTYIELNYTNHPDYNIKLDNLQTILNDFMTKTIVNINKSYFFKLNTQNINKPDNVEINYTIDNLNFSENEIIKSIIIEIFKDTNYYNIITIKLKKIDDIKIHILNNLIKNLRNEKKNYTVDTEVINEIDIIINNINKLFNLTLNTIENIILFLKNIIIIFSNNDNYTIPNGKIIINNDYLIQKLKIRETINFLNDIEKLTNYYISNPIINNVKTILSQLIITNDNNIVVNKINDLILLLKRKANKNNITISFDKPITEIISMFNKFKRDFCRLVILFGYEAMLAETFLLISFL